MDLSVIILTYNAKDLTVQMLRSLEKVQPAMRRAGYRWEVIVSDNGSTDGVIEEIKKFRWVKLIENGENLGFSAGNNVGVRHANPQSRCVLFLNPDVIVPPETIPGMIKYLDDHPQVGMATCRVDLWSGGLDKDCRRGFPTPWTAFVHFFTPLGRLFPRVKLFGGYHYTYLSPEKEHEIDACLGAFMIVRREVGEAVGWWDESFKFYGEDLDFCYQIKKRGWQIRYYPGCRIIHYKGGASGVRKESRSVTQASRATREWVLRQSTYAMERFYRKNYWDKYPRLVNWLVIGGVKLKAGIRLVWFRLGLR